MIGSPLWSIYHEDLSNGSHQFYSACGWLMIKIGELNGPNRMLEAGRRINSSAHWIYLALFGVAFRRNKILSPNTMSLDTDSWEYLYQSGHH